MYHSSRWFNWASAELGDLSCKNPSQPRASQAPSPILSAPLLLYYHRRGLHISYLDDDLMYNTVFVHVQQACCWSAGIGSKRT